MADDGSSLHHPVATDTPDTEQDPWIGRTLASYRLIRRIGWGGMGVVYQAQHPSLERYAAVKFLAANLAMDKTYIDMFLREAKAAAKLNHPNIIAIYDCGSIGEDIYYLIMGYIAGRDLRSMLREQLVLPVPEAIHYVRQVCSGLAYAHTKKVIHRDIKPENLMLTDDGIIKIGDLGLAKWIGEDSGSLTQTGLVMGSPFYIAPERLRGDPQVNETTDVYSLGGTLFHLLTGKVPYEGTAPVVMAKHLDSPVPNPLDVNPSLDPRLCHIVMKMMAKDQKSRYQNMQEVDADLADFEKSLSHPVMRAIPTKEQSSANLEVPEDLAMAGIIVADPHAAAGARLPSPSQEPEAKKFSMPIGAFAGIAALLCLGLVWFFWPRHATKSPVIPPPPAEESSLAVTPAQTAVAAGSTATPRAEGEARNGRPAQPTAKPPEPTALPKSAVVRPAEVSVPPKPAPGGVVLLHNFEEGTEGWKIDAGCNMGGPTRSNDYAHSGNGSIVFRHFFKNDDDTASGFVSYKSPKNFSGYKEIRAWVYLPGGKDQWSIQMYVRSGSDLTLSWGKVHKAWLGDWHLVKLDVKDIKHPENVRDLGIQIKNRADTRAALYYDQVEAVGN